MPSVLKSLLDNLSSRITENKSDITTIEENITQLDTALSTVQTEVETARGGSASLDARLDNMTTATENAQSDASTAQTTANEAAASANTANSNIAAAADTFDSLKARLDDMTENITNVTADVSTNTDDISDINTQLNTTNSNVSAVTSEVTTARGSYSNLNARFESVDDDLEAAQNDAAEALGTANTANTTANTAIKTAALLRFSSIGKFMNTTAMSSYNGMSVNTPYYFDANGNTTSQTDSVIKFTKYANNPMFFDISISNILTVTTDDLIAPTSPITITVQGVIYNVYFIMLPYSTFNPEALDTICIMEPSPFIITNNPQAINVESIGSVTNTPVLSTTEAVRAYIPVLRPATNPGTIFRFLTTAIDPDTNTVQYYFSNSGFAFGL
jgi:predicted  nucleic acid-binding Zn-ribbon protein